MLAVKFLGCRFQQSRLTRATGDYADFSGADLAGADLVRGGFSRTKWIASRLAGADLDQSWLLYANLEGADLTGVSLRYASLVGASLCRAILRESDLLFANLCQADLEGVDLTAARLPEGAETTATAAGTVRSGRGAR